MLMSGRFLSTHRFQGASFAAFLWEEDLVDLWSDTTLGESDLSEELVQLFIVADSELDVSWGDGLLLVLVAALARQIKDLHTEVL